MEVRKATRQDLKRHNRLSLLRAVYYKLADNRAALAVATGLTKPTVSELAAELIEEGYLIEGGTGGSTELGGKPPRLLAFVPDARQVIGVSVDGVEVRALLINLAGQVAAEHLTPLDGKTGEDALRILLESINALVAQLDAPLLAVSVGVPGVIDAGEGVVRRSAVMGWYDLPLAQRLAEQYDCPAYVANNTQLAALAQVAGDGDSAQADHNRVTLLVNGTVEVGVTVRGAAYHHGGDIGGLRVAPRPDADPVPLNEVLGWQAVQRRAHALREMHPGSRLPESGLTYLHIRHAAALGDPAAGVLLEELASVLATAVVWSMALLQPQTVVLAGQVADLGDLLLDRLRFHAAERLSIDEVAAVQLALAGGLNLSARGAAVLAVHSELDILS